MSFKNCVAAAAVGAVGGTLVGSAIAVGVILIATPAKSQPALPPPGEQALGSKLMGEIQAGLTCEAAKITIQRRLEELEKRLRDAEAKAQLEPK